jgi:hypothetical protein
VDANCSKVSYVVPIFVMSVYELAANLRRSGSTMCSLLSLNGMSAVLDLWMFYPVMLLSRNLEQYVIIAGSLRVWSSIDVEGRGGSVLGSAERTSVAYFICHLPEP